MVPSFRTGLGYDIHPLETNRRLVLGGVEIPFEKGLGGHSDADVLTHAIIDALLGAAGKGDMGVYFPDSDPRFRGISSLRLLEDVREMLAGDGFTVSNIDTVVLAQAPRLQKFKDSIRSRLAKTLNVPEEIINIKAKTPEGLDAIGRGEGISAQAVCLLTRPGS